MIRTLACTLIAVVLYSSAGPAPSAVGGENAPFIEKPIATAGKPASPSVAEPQAIHALKRPIQVKDRMEDRMEDRHPSLSFSPRGERENDPTETG